MRFAQLATVVRCLRPCRRRYRDLSRARHHRRESNSLQADLLNVPVVRPRVSETTALGAAYLAGLAVGYWKNQADIARQWQANKRFTPAMKAPERKRMASGWERALGRAKAWEEA